MSLRKLMAGLFSLLLVVSLIAPSAHADDATRRAKVEQLFTLIHLEATYGQLMTQVMAQATEMTGQLFPDGAMTDAQKKQAADFQSKVSALVQDSFSWDALKPDYIKLYTDEYTEPELDGMIAFYNSPVGQSMLAKTPEVMKASSAIAMGRMATVQPKMRQMMEDFARQVKGEQSDKTGKQ